MVGGVTVVLNEVYCGAAVAPARRASGARRWEATEVGELSFIADLG
jgi:hypothetical protein